MNDTPNTRHTTKGGCQKPVVVQDANPAGLNTVNIDIKSPVAIQSHRPRTRHGMHAELQRASAAGGVLPCCGKKQSNFNSP